LLTCDLLYIMMYFPEIISHYFSVICTRKMQNCCSNEVVVFSWTSMSVPFTYDLSRRFTSCCCNELQVINTFMELLHCALTELCWICCCSPNLLSSIKILCGKFTLVLLLEQKTSTFVRQTHIQSEEAFC